MSCPYHVPNVHDCWLSYNISSIVKVYRVFVENSQIPQICASYRALQPVERNTMVVLLGPQERKLSCRIDLLLKLVSWSQSSVQPPNDLHLRGVELLQRARTSCLSGWFR